MRVFVAVEAASDLKMKLSPMALAALRDGFLHCRGMPDVAASASHAFVLSAGDVYVGRRIGMALHTVLVCQRGLLLGMRRA